MRWKAFAGCLTLLGLTLLGLTLLGLTLLGLTPSAAPAAAHGLDPGRVVLGAHDGWAAAPPATSTR